MVLETIKLNIDSDVLKKISTKADELGTTRNNLINEYIIFGLNQNNTILDDM